MYRLASIPPRSSTRLDRSEEYSSDFLMAMWLSIGDPWNRQFHVTRSVPARLQPQVSHRIVSLSRKPLDQPSRGTQVAPLDGQRPPPGRTTGPLPAIDEAVQRVRDQSITEYEYDHAMGSLRRQP